MSDFTKRELLRVMALTMGALALTQPAWSEDQPIKIGSSMALSGPLAGGGRQSQLALQMWVEDVNSRGGLLGRKVELVTYDDQGSPAQSPGIFSKLIDLDNADLLIAPYGTVPAAAVMPLVKERGRLLIGQIGYQINSKVHHDMWFNNSPWNDAESWVGGFFKLGETVGVKKVAFLAADQEFSQNILAGAKALAGKAGFETVYEQTYPPTTVDFSAMIRAIRAASPDMVFVASYPADSTAIIRAVNEIGVGSSVKLFGGGMVGLQYASVMQALGSQLNGVVNYHTYVPEKTMAFPGVKEFLDRYAEKAKAAKVETLGYYVAPFSYASGQILEQAVKATGSLDNAELAKYLRTNEVQTIVGPIRWGTDGEWSQPRVVMVQFRDVKDGDAEQFRQEGKQVIVYPDKYKTGDLVSPLSGAQGR
ncbi:branched-chain amino acid ABC transporter substrate-binding protein [Rhizobium leguminosarum bv. viciae]|uniref:Branched-chain amino acid ABC transporter binding component n=2 Tax=Rhizobium TaxID=379 RepID=Q1M9I2_RHIJ3|nr:MULTISPECIES: amino acid ABC transporter substrate-binding protein [Rhizobium]MBX5160791.1 amino acid ABC transporter substrate-binding protein [Rhizobium sp. NZLR8]MBY5344933.1 amino acid ABC transporter substrate-binding protein [Rhizobium leguminosarum]MBY5481249.1 amino acid ABC transporter substrate-binding protein [Rhizobium leguminosarum]MBY5847893.1 amino acid ABC transporter substrate-binding protein [Rhizobium leguminosarum]TAT71107.1 branched-chain amino acid ABC transporter subs